MNIDKNREFKEKVIDNDFNLEFQSTKIAKYISSLEQENTQLKQQLKDKDEKISKAKEFILENTYEQIEYLDNVSQYYDRKLNNILEILESNKED